MKIVYPVFKKTSVLIPVKKLMAFIAAIFIMAHGFAQATLTVNVPNPAITVCYGTTVQMVSTEGAVTWAATGGATIQTSQSYTTPPMTVSTIYYYSNGEGQNPIQINVLNPADSVFTSPIPALCFDSSEAFIGAASCTGNALIGNGTSTGAISTADTYPMAVQDNLTMEAKVKWNGANTGSTSQYILLNGNGGSSGYSIYIDATSKTLNILLGGVSVLISNAQLTIGKWQHVAAVRASGTWALYVDGVAYALTNATATPNVPANGAFCIGQNNIQGESFNGAIDEVRVWDTALGLATINSLRQICYPASGVNLRGYWKFDETSGTLVNDASQYNFSLKLNTVSRGISAGYAWNFGDGTANGTGVSTTHAYTSQGNKTVTLTVSDIDGCPVSSKQTLNVNNNKPIALSPITASATTICAGSSVTLSTVDNNLIFSEDFNGGFSTITSQGWTMPVNTPWQQGSAFDQINTPDGSGFWSASVYPSAPVTGLLESPSFNTTGLTGLTLEIQEYANITTSGFGCYIQMSTDNNSWTNVAVYSNSVGQYNNFATQDITVPTTFENKQSVYLRFYFKDTAGTDSYAIWAINSVYLFKGTVKPVIQWSSVPVGFTATGGATQIVTLGVSTTYIVQESTGCITPTVSKTITVNPLPQAAITASNTSVCAETPVTITLKGLNATGPYTFYYNVDGGPQQTATSGAGDSVNITLLPNATTTYTVTQVSSTEGCTVQLDSTMLTITVNDPPLARISGGGNYCTTGAAGTVKMWGIDAPGPYTFNYTEAGTTHTAASAAGSDTAYIAVPQTAGTYVYTVTSATGGTGCQSAISGITATANELASPVVSVSPFYAGYCGTPVTLTASGASKYTWSPGTGLSGTSGLSLTASPTATTVYEVTGTSNGCTDSASVVVVNGTMGFSPSGPTASVCVGSTITLNSGATATTGVPVFREDFNHPVTGWVIKNDGTGGTPANAAWANQPNGYTYVAGSGSYTFNPGSGFYITNSSAQGAAGTTATSLQSPAFSTVGFSNMQISMRELFIANTSGAAVSKIQLSTDGTNWTDASSRTGTSATTDSTDFYNTTVSVPAGFANKPAVYIRFAYNNANGAWWAIDSLLITGTLTPTWSWASSPAGFSSTAQNPTAVINANTQYALTATSSIGCTQTESTGTVPVVPAIALTIGSAAPITPGGSVPISLPYTITQGAATIFSVSPAGPNPVMPGFPPARVELLTAPSGVASIPVSSGVAAGVYNFTFSVYANSDSYCQSNIEPFTVVVGDNNNNLSALVANNFSFSPAFDSSITSYTAAVGPAVTSVTLTPTLADATASINVNTVAVGNNQASQAIAMATGVNTVNIVVTAQNGTTKVYTITLTKQANINVTGAATNANTAYSLRQLSTANLHAAITLPALVSGFTNATWAAVRVRRQKDNALLDIGYSGTTLDTATLKSFAGSGNAFVTIWYDQSGNNLDAVQATAASQPLIVSNGVVERKNGLPTVYFTGKSANNVFLSTQAFTAFSSGMSLFTAAGVSADNPTTNGLVTKTGASQPAPWDIYTNTFDLGNGSTPTQNFIAKPFAAASAFAIWGFTAAPGVVPMAYFNGNTNGTLTAPAQYADGGTPVILGSRGDGGSRLNGWISEAILFPSFVSNTDEDTVTANQMATYLAPSIKAVTPSMSGIGTTVRITGLHFTGATAVSFNNNTATAFTIVSDTVITAVVPPNATGTVSVIRPFNTAAFAGFSLPAPPGNALAFDGVDDYVAIPAASLNNLGTGTFESWVYLNSNTEATILIKQSEDVGTEAALTVGYYVTGGSTPAGGVPGIIYYRSQNSGTLLTGNTPLQPGHWYHIALTFTATSASLYINGSLDATVSGGNFVVPNVSVSANPINTTLGAWIYAGTPQHRLNGSLDELRIFNTDRTANIGADMLNAVPPTTGGVITYYQFDQGTASGNNTAITYVADGISTANNGTPTNFSLSGATSNFVESYAMVVPTATAATNIGYTIFTSNWVAPAIGTVDSFKVSVATDTAFTNIVAGYDSAQVVGNLTSLTIKGLSANTKYYYRVRANKASVAGQGTWSGIVSVTTLPPLSWTGAVSTSWATAGNWGSNLVPLATDDVLIPASPINQPVISTAVATNNLIIASGAMLTINAAGTLTAAGSISSSGTFNASTGSVVLNSAAAQTINGSIVVNNLTIDNANGVSINSGIIKVYGTYTPQAGVLTTNGNLVLASTANGTASVAQSSASNYVTGNVTVERYIPAHRAWRLLTAPLSNTGTIYQNWQNNGFVTDTTGASIWQPGGTGGSGNGFTAGGEEASIESYDPVANNWVGLSNTTSTLLSGTSATAANTGLGLFVTGPFGSNNIVPSTGATATTLRATGSLQTGTQQFVNNGLAAGTFMLVGNPYASPLNFTSIGATGAASGNISNTMWAWDAQRKGTSYGGYVTFSWDATSGSYDQDIDASQTAQTMAVQSGEAFFVQAVNSGTATVTINESDKASTSAITGGVFGLQPAPTPSQQIRITLSRGAELVDGVMAKFGDVYKTGVSDDVDKLFDYDENLSLRIDTNYLAIERRPVPAAGDTIFLDVYAVKKSTAYSFTVNPQNMPTGLQAWLVDAYTNTKTVLSMAGSTSVSFNTGTDAGSLSETRFVIVFQTNGVLATATTLKAVPAGSAVQVEWVTPNELGVKQYQVQRSAGAQSFTAINTAAARNSGNKEAYDYTDEQPITGDNYYRIEIFNSDGTVTYSNVVLVKMARGAASFSIYPNPTARNRQVHVQFSGMPAGKYALVLYSTNGKQLMDETLQLDDTTATTLYTISLPQGIASGSYRIVLLDGNGGEWKQQVIVQ